MTRGGRVEAGQDNGLRPLALSRGELGSTGSLSVSLPALPSTTERVWSNSSLVSCLVPPSGHRGCSRWAALRAATGLLFVRGGGFKVQNPTPCPQCSDDISTGQISISRYERYIRVLGECQIYLQSKWRLPKRPKERQQKILCVLIFSAECPVPSLRFCDLQKTLRAETWHTCWGKYSPKKYGIFF